MSKYSLRIILAALILVGVLLYQGYRQRCDLLTCTPLTWPELQAMARTYAEKAGPGYRFERMYVEPAHGTAGSVGEPDTLRVRMKFVAPEPSENGPDEGMHSVSTVEFEDPYQTVQWKGRGEWTSNRPSPEWQQRFDRVRIGPRDVYRLTWERAQQDLSSTIWPYADMKLYLDDWLQAQGGPESQWVIDYYDDDGSITYNIDAQTGAIVGQRTWQRGSTEAPTETATPAGD